MNFCNKCGREISKKYNFCYRCSHLINETAVKYVGYIVLALFIIGLYGAFVN